jgi:hypothetical protein
MEREENAMGPVDDQCQSKWEMGNGQIQTKLIWHFHLFEFYVYGFNFVRAKRRNSTVE